MADHSYDLVEPEDEDKKPEDGKPQDEKTDLSRFFDEDEDQAPPPAPKPAPAPQPARPLPRLVRFSDPEDEETARRRPARKEPEAAPSPAETPRTTERKPKPVSRPKPPRAHDEPGEKKGVLDEQTPELDTYETRSKIRLSWAWGRSWRWGWRCCS